METPKGILLSIQPLIKCDSTVSGFSQPVFPSRLPIPAKPTPNHQNQPILPESSLNPPCFTSLVFIARLVDELGALVRSFGPFFLSGVVGLVVGVVGRGWFVLWFVVALIDIYIRAFKGFLGSKAQTKLINKASDEDER